MATCSTYLFIHHDHDLHIIHCIKLNVVYDTGKVEGGCPMPCNFPISHMKYQINVLLVFILERITQ